MTEKDNYILKDAEGKEIQLDDEDKEYVIPIEELSHLSFCLERDPNINPCQLLPIDEETLLDEIIQGFINMIHKIDEWWKAL